MHWRLIYKVCLLLSFLFFSGSCSLIKPIIVKKQYSLDDVYSAISSENYSLAYKEIKYINTSNLSYDDLMRYNFIQAVLSYKTAHYELAEKYLEALLTSKIQMQDYIYWYLANIYIKTNNYNQAINALQIISNSYTLSVFYKPAIMLMADCLVKENQYSTAIQLYSTYITNPIFYNQLPKMLIYRAALYISENDIDNGISDYVRVYTSFPETHYADTALKALSKITDVSTLNIDHSAIASLLMIDGKYSAALPELKLAINSYKQENNTKALSNLLKNLGIAYYYNAQYTNAIQALKQAIQYNVENEHKAEILFWLGKTYLKDGDTQNAEKVFLKIVNTKSSYTPIAMYKLFQIYQKNNNQKTAENWLIKLANLHTPFSILANWELGWYYYKQGKFTNAIYYLNELEHSKYSDDLEKVKAMYWKARALLKSGDIQQSQKIFFKIINNTPLSYYSVMSHIWFNTNTLVFNVRDLLIPPPILIIDKDSAFYYHYSRYSFLSSIGFRKEAIEELDEASQLDLTKEESLLLCYEYYKNNDYFDSLYMARTKFSDKLQTLNSDTLPVWFYSYPLGYANILKGYNEKYGIDPMIFYALILQESRFKPDVVSNAGALGIMQVMPSTAKKVAKEINLKPFYPELLLDPQINIGIGTWYFNNLLRKYKGNYVLSLAAYNAGEKAIDSWLKNSNDCNTDEFIEDIPFEETRHYVKNILTNLVAYSMIYGDTINLSKHLYLEGNFLKGCSLTK